MDRDNGILETIRERRSYRGRYLPEPVPREDLRAILEAGLAAPSGCNKQTTSLLCVDDPAVLARHGVTLNELEDKLKKNLVDELREIRRLSTNTVSGGIRQ